VYVQKKSLYFASISSLSDFEGNLAWPFLARSVIVDSFPFAIETELVTVALGGAIAAKVSFRNLFWLLRESRKSKG
jgi:hypothetical protein